MKSALKKFLKSKIFWMSIGVIFFASALLLLLLSIPNLHLKDYNSEITISYGSEFVPDNSDICYGNIFSCEPVEVSIIGEVDTTKIGDYEIVLTLKYNNQTRDIPQVIHVADITQPEIIIEIDHASICSNGKISPFKYTVIDNLDGDISDKAIIEEAWEKQIKITVSDTSGNQTIKTLPSITEDIEAPVISLNGEAEYNLTVGEHLDIPAPSAIDNCDGEVSVEKSGTVDESKIGSYTLTYSATDQAGNSSSITRKVTVEPKNTGVIYLTFDDGPSEYTDKLLDILKKYDVKATFFVTSSGSDETILREYNEGHTVALHSSSHSYAYIYQNPDIYFGDLLVIQNRVKNITGQTSYLVRFPGGSSNTVSTLYDGGTHIMTYLASELKKRGYTYFDWNLSSGDAGGATNSNQVYNNVVNALYKDGKFIVLQHDTKKFSIDAVERIIQYGKNHGYTFRKLDASSPTMHHRISN